MACPARTVSSANTCTPARRRLWKKHGKSSVVGVSDDEPGVSFWKIKNGIRLTGMPSYQRIYTDAQMWQIALLLKNADQPLPDPVMGLLAVQAAGTNAGSAEKPLP